jgi:hypothetical protein
VALTWDHQTTTARVMAIGATSGIRASHPGCCWVDITFTADGRPVTTRLFLREQDVPSGSRMEIDYLPSHPRTTRLAGQFWTDQVQAAALELGIPLAVVVSIGAPSLIRRRRRRTPPRLEASPPRDPPR